MEQVFKKIIESNAYDIDGVAHCLASLAVKEGINNILKLCVNGIDNWNINVNYLAEYIDKEYHDYENIVITNIICNYAYRNIEVNLNYNFTRYYINENAGYYDNYKTSAQEDYIFPKTFTGSNSINVYYNDYLNFVKKYHPESLNELKEEA